MKEEEVARREYEAEQARLEKERSHYESVVAALQAKGDAAAVASNQERLEEINQAIEGVRQRAANTRAGYVYVISNVGAFRLHGDLLTYVDHPEAIEWRQSETTRRARTPSERSAES